ncbi:Hypothetical protein R9X50_00758500 [Acrodontium crateriforme]|uniref:F-box domain-containing protein n=1 Tax=Acrodontium crateriforme TaxID=150365 RepID=A0AAQ3M9Y3_9PEZI|nr:Hypothetical protein R9X50_00758500 [Acrodontium crateriforme]
MEASPFMKLSAELRNIIYELVLIRHDPIRILPPSSAVRFQPPLKDTGRANNHVLALTQTCRRIRHESWKLFYASNTFVCPAGVRLATVPSLIGPFTCFYACISSQAAAVLRSITIDLGSIRALQFSDGLMARRMWLELFIRMVEMSHEGFPITSFQLRFELTFLGIEDLQPMEFRLEAHNPHEALRESLAQLEIGCFPSLSDRGQGRLHRVRKVMKEWYRVMEILNRVAEEKQKYQPIHIEPLRIWKHIPDNE